MTRKFREFKKSLIQETARVKLYKSGKSWVKASIREFHFLKALGLSFLSHGIVKNEEGEVTVAFGDKVKQQALRTTAIAGGMFTVNMLHDQQAFAASDPPLTSEMTTKSQTVGDQTSITIEKSTSGDSQSQQGVESERNADSEATPVSTHQTNAASSESTSRLSASQSASMSTSDSKSASTSTSASDAAKAESESSQSNQDETSQSASSESESKSTEKDTKVVSQQHQASAVVQNISSTSIDSRTNHRNDSLSQIKNEAKNESLAQSPFSATQSPNSAVQRVNIQPRSAQGYSGFRAAGAASNSNVLPRRDKSKPFTERSKVSKVFVNQATGYNPYAPIYSKTVIYSDGKTMEIFNLISLDNPNTPQIEKNGWPAQQQNNAIKNTATHANNPHGKLKLGRGYGKPTIQQGAWDINAKTWIGGTSTKATLGDATSGYYWDAAQYQKYMAERIWYCSVDSCSN
ncbi:KxYKxGKxW signal peptide domain-containing protein [Staphylococcus delphini]|uniref:KxYKxGKxW signal peptide domain-containing protein n=1 Tax=Staphylococcus delphini TaxID=53344 RepID=UPI0021D194D1|nr:KxYKxGKxW signal peptide domain-containing protein [Staphylococcus delphini]UXS37116.1 KxYKxGKxW signal peptide domain-containing protein [Staphylococcus delphini]